MRQTEFVETLLSPTGKGKANFTNDDSLSGQQSQRKRVRGKKRLIPHVGESSLTYQPMKT